MWLITEIQNIYTHMFDETEANSRQAHKYKKFGETDKNTCETLYVEFQIELNFRFIVIVQVYREVPPCYVRDGTTSFQPKRIHASVAV